MSRIGKKTITVPQGVEVKIEGNTISVKGPKGALRREMNPGISANLEEGKITITRSGNEAKGASLNGLLRALVSNMITGVSKGFEKKMEIIGVGYRAQVNGKKITLSLGFSHPIEYTVPHEIEVEMDKENKNIMIIKGADKQVVGQVAADIRSYRKPEPYKGKGICYVGEHIVRKAGKAAAGAGAKE